MYFSWSILVFNDGISINNKNIQAIGSGNEPEIGVVQAGTGSPEINKNSSELVNLFLEQSTDLISY